MKISCLHDAVSGESAAHAPRTASAPADTIKVKVVSEQSAGILIEAIAVLNRRGEGPRAWATSFLQDPIAFLIDALSDPIRIRDADGHLLYQNTSAEELPPGLDSKRNFMIRGHRYLCRRVEYTTKQGALILEVFALER